MAKTCNWPVLTLLFRRAGIGAAGSRSQTNNGAAGTGVAFPWLGVAEHRRFLTLGVPERSRSLRSFCPLTWRVVNGNTLA